VATFVAKLAAGPIRLATLQTGNFQFGPTLIAELGSYFIVKLAFWALHL
jgi:hypothetical protein